MWYKFSQTAYNYTNLVYGALADFKLGYNYQEVLSRQMSGVNQNMRPLYERAVNDAKREYDKIVGTDVRNLNTPVLVTLREYDFQITELLNKMTEDSQLTSNMLNPFSYNNRARAIADDINNNFAPLINNINKVAESLSSDGELSSVAKNQIVLGEFVKTFGSILSKAKQIVNLVKNNDVDNVKQMGNNVVHYLDNIQNYYDYYKNQHDLLVNSSLHPEEYPFNDTIKSRYGLS